MHKSFRAKDNKFCQGKQLSEKAKTKTGVPFKLWKGSQREALYQKKLWTELVNLEDQW